MFNTCCKENAFASHHRPCQRPGAHNFVRMEHCVLSEVMVVVIDNGSSMVVAFREYVAQDIDEEDDDEDEDANSECHEDD